ncbi:MAG: HD domain-containing protein [Planctomycetota bacterium]|nr:MAG: HD domain-containing protein [Planctomycetota bacterium]
MASKVIRDAVHGDIELDTEALSVLDTPEMQRLRRIAQLGTASLVYPSAVHTRFEHALGTYHLTGRLLERLERTHGGSVLEPAQRRATRLAALVHDVTHVPFGHTFEDERRIWPRHDEPEHVRAMLRRGALGEALERTGLRDLVEDTLVGNPPVPLMADLVRGTVGADLLDYLARDALLCGFSRRWDERLLRYYAVSGATRRLAFAVYKRSLLRHDAVSEILELLWLRHMLCERVYFHHAKIAAGAMISRAVEWAVAGGLQREALYEASDHGLAELLRPYLAHEPAAGRLLAALAARRLHRRAYVLTRAIGTEAQRELVARYHHDPAAREHAERELAARTGLRPGELIIYCPSERMASKEVEIPVLDPAGTERPLAALRLPEVDLLLERHRDLWRLYVFVAADRLDRREAVGRAASAWFGFANELDAEARHASATRYDKRNYNV